MFSKSVFSFPAIILLIFIILIGIWDSSTAVFACWSADVDIAAIYEIIHGIDTDGWAFIHRYWFGIDNFLINIILPDWILSRLLGDSPFVILLTGLFTFWLTAILTGLVVWKASRSPLRGCFAGALVLLAPQSALGWGGSLTSSWCHNSAILWCLSAIFCLEIFSISHSFCLKILASFFSICFLLGASFSDPWALAAFSGPIFAASVIIALLKYRDKRVFITYLLIAVGTLITVVGAKTQLFTLLPLRGGMVKGYIGGFSPSYGSFLRLLDYITFYFNEFFVPYHRAILTDDWGEDRPWPSHVLRWGNSICFFGVLAWIAFQAKKKWRYFSLETQFLTLVSFFSIFFISVSGISLDLFMYPSRARYIPNFYYFGLILFCLFFPKKIFSGQNTSLYFKKFLITLGCCWGITGIISNIHNWFSCWHKPIFVHPQIGPFLEEQGVHQAYGQYWLAGGNAVTWQMHARVQVAASDYSYESKDFNRGMWSDPKDYDKGDQNEVRAFILPDKVSWCPPFPTCRQALLNQFGEPIKSIYKDGTEFLFYPASQLFFSKISSPADLPVAHYMKLQHLVPIWRGYWLGNVADPYNLIMLNGWQSPEGATITTKGHRAELTLVLPQNVDKKIAVRLFLKRKGMENTKFSISSGSQVLVTGLATEATNRLEFEVQVPKKAKYDAQKRVTLLLDLTEAQKNLKTVGLKVLRLEVNMFPSVENN